MSLTCGLDDSHFPCYILQSQLPDIACSAAVELDQLSLNSAQGFENSQKILDWLRKNVVYKPNEIPDPTIATLMHYVLKTMHVVDDSVKTYKQLVSVCDQYKEKIRRVLEDPQKAQKENPQEIEHLRDFMLQLSKSASSHEAQSECAINIS